MFFFGKPDAESYIHPQIVQYILPMMTPDGNNGGDYINLFNAVSN